MQYQIVPITETHIESFCAAVDNVAKERKFLAFLEGPSLEKVRSFVLESLNGNMPHLVAVSENRVIGWCDISSMRRESFAHAGILSLGLLSSYRGHGIGEALLCAALEKAKLIGLTRVELTVRETNVPAIALYEKLGFVYEGLKRNAIRVDNVYENLICMALLLE